MLFIRGILPAPWIRVSFTLAPLVIFSICIVVVRKRTYSLPCRITLDMQPRQASLLFDAGHPVEPIVVISIVDDVGACVVSYFCIAQMPASSVKAVDDRMRIKLYAIVVIILIRIFGVRFCVRLKRQYHRNALHILPRFYHRRVRGSAVGIRAIAEAAKDKLCPYPIHPRIRDGNACAFSSVLPAKGSYTYNARYAATHIQGTRASRVVEFYACVIPHNFHPPYQNIPIRTRA